MTTALVTGGTSGIGAAFARALAEEGHDLVLVARDAGRLADSATELHDAYGIEVEVMSADLADRDDVLRVAHRLESTEQPVELLVNNAGFGVRTRIIADDPGPHEHAIDVMIRAVLLLSNAAGRTMKARRHGTIINVSSTAGLMTMGSYSAIKAWVTTFTESLANELQGTGVQVTALLPGWVRTEFHQRAEIGTGKIPDQLWVDADRLVVDCLADAAHHKVLSMPSKRYKVLMGLIRHLPRPAVRAVSRRLTSGRH
jgi:short-subunit dehydrogenase